MVTQRTWLEAQRAAWHQPREWGPTQLAILAGLVLTLVLAAYAVSRPGAPLGGPSALEALPVFVDHTAGRYVYELPTPPDGGTERMGATLRELYDARRTQTRSNGITIVLLRRATDVGPYVNGSGGLDAEGVLGWARVGPNGTDAAVRRTPEEPLEPIALS
jgi:hypothetical protein